MLFLNVFHFEFISSSVFLPYTPSLCFISNLEFIYPSLQLSFISFMNPKFLLQDIVLISLLFQFLFVFLEGELAYQTSPLTAPPIFALIRRSSLPYFSVSPSAFPPRI